MTNSFIDDLRADGLAVDDLTVKTNSSTSKPAKARPTFPCESCRGTGRYQGVRLHQPEEKCFACKGKGYFFTSYADRQAKRVSSRVNKAVKLEKAKAEFMAECPGLIEKVTEHLLPWNAFAVELMDQFNTKGSLSQKQTEALSRQVEKKLERDAAKALAKAAETSVAASNPIDTSAIRDLFDGAKSRGLKKPGIWYGDLKISEAPMTGTNAGALYVKQSGNYVGKIVGSTFHPAWGVKQAPILADLLTIAAEPAEALRAKGKETGKCCCCGRELTDPESVAAGIGPICATSWGL